MAEKRLYSLERTLSKRPEVRRQYAEVIDAYLTKGYIRRLGDQEQRQRQFLLPHFPVVRSDKETTKVRVVFDAAAKHGGKSLNDELNAGPKLQRDLVNVLLAFCLEPVAIVGVEGLPSDQEMKWLVWFGELEALSRVRIPRCLKDTRRPSRDATLTVHTFTDASADATAAVCYVRASYPDGHVQVNLAYARARAAPLKKVTIPKLELRGAVLGLRVSKIVGEALNLPIDQHVFWTDSMNVVYWVRSAARNFTIDVANRIGEIQELTKPTQWRHVPGVQNPADVGTRGTRAADLADNKKWWQGPEFLTRPAEEWPQTQLASKPALPGVLKKKVQATLTVTATEFRLSPARYSSWEKLLRVTGWCERFIRLARRSGALGHEGALCVTRQQWPGSRTRAARQDSRAGCRRDKSGITTLAGGSAAGVHGSTIGALMAGRALTPSDPLYKLNPSLDRSASPALLVVGGRLKCSSHLPADLREPIILPPRHRITQLIIQQEDTACRHDAGAHHLLANLRARYWIIHGLSAVKAVRRDCILCQRRTARPAGQIMGPLPDHRTKGSFRPFSHSGVDFAGPFLTRQSRGRAQQKRYLCLFTCLETRACHLEMAFSLDTDSFLMAFSRFIKRRGCPSVMVSDNGTNFTSAERELREAVTQLDKAKIHQEGVQQGLQWKFNPPRSPHHGGVPAPRGSI